MGVRVAVVAVFVAALLAGVGQRPVRATIVRVVPITVDVSSGAFTLRYLPARGIDTGCASVAVHPVKNGTRGHLEGIAILRGARGTLALHLAAMRLAGRRVSGRWSVVGSTGSYAGRGGRGTFTARSSFAVAEYRGAIVIAQ